MLEKRKLISNSLSMLINRLVQSIATFVLTAAIARILGAEALGQYLLAFSYYFIFVNIASQGLKTLFTRELAREPEKTSIFLTNGTLLQFIFALIGYVALAIVVFLLPYSVQTSTVCYIMGLTIIPFSLSNITEAIFQAQERMHLIALSTVPVYVLRVMLMIWAMQMKYGVNTLAEILLASEAIILVIEWLLLIGTVKLKWQIEKDFIWNSIKAARTFFAIEGIAVVSSRMQILIISLLGNEALVGIYGGIVQLMQPFLIIANSMATAIFPTLSKAVAQGKAHQRKITENFIEILLIIALPLLMGCWFFSKDLLIFLYNPSFAQGSLALNIITLTLLFLPFNRALSNLLVANGLEKFNLREVVITNTIGSFLGVLLVSQFQLLGAATTDLVMRILGFSQYCCYTYSRLFPLNILQIIRRPVLITFLMLPVFLILKGASHSFLTTLIISTVIYCLIIGFMGINYLGGIRVVWSKVAVKR
ncbi:polysaccharide biosynthesis protein [Anabaenopsis circularis NIES-21]|uniref:Polysaccharide biosynthesis protein n=1 Tax=Anabaenopsis circularis NIES-21 TaxID=1085406 RepID=A0A1Z4GJ04_9CYAN|nr:polysaccharide biosynthesis protein [Anabaenopsis circularis NIES-21]